MIVTDEALLLSPSLDVSKDEEGSLLERLEYELSQSKELGIGLAACQIGILKRAFIIRISKKHRYDFINPKITELAEPIIFTREGCLSYPGKQIRTLRYNKVEIFDDLHPEGLMLTGLPSVAVQHEYQHTLGQSMFRNELSNVKDDDLCLCGSNLVFSVCCKVELRKNMRVI